MRRPFFLDMNTYYLVRHAHADWVPDESRSLSAQGMRDAERLAGLLRPLPITAFYSSPYRRAEQTIAPAAAALDLPITLAPGLRERALGDFGGDTFQTAVRTTWENPDFAYPGGETNRAARQRGLIFMEKLQARHTGDHIVLGTHGNLLALIMQGYDPTLGYTFWAGLTMPDLIRLVLDGNALVRYDRLWPPAAEPATQDTKGEQRT